MLGEGIIKELHLDPELIELDLRVCEGMGHTYEAAAKKKSERAEIEIMLAISATNFRRAGAHALLLNKHDLAQKLFSNAAWVYDKLNLPYAIIMSTFTREIPESWKNINYWLGNKMPESHYNLIQRQLVYILLYSATLDKRILEENEIYSLRKIRKNLEAYRLYPIGTLGLSIGSYLDLTDSLDENLALRNIDLREATLSFFNEYNTAINKALRNRYHWKRLAFPFHPIEPDIFGVLIMLESAMISRQKGSILEILETLPLFWESQVLLKGILSEYC